MGSRALLRFSSDKQQSECAVIIFSRHRRVEKDGCRRCSSKQDVARFRLLFGWKSARCKTQSRRRFFFFSEAGEESMAGVKSRPDSTAVGQGSVTAKQTGFVDSRDCLRFQTVPSLHSKSHLRRRDIRPKVTHIALLLTCKSHPISEHYYGDPLTYRFHGRPEIHHQSTSPPVSFHESSVLYSSPTLFSNV